MPKNKLTFFQRLTNLFRSGPVVRRKIRGFDTVAAATDVTKSSGTLLFQRSLSPTYTRITSNSYNLSERLMRYNDFEMMEQTPEISSALDLWADETVSQDEKGRALHIYSDNPKIKEILEDLFYNTINLEFNLRSWARNLVKFGDLFVYIDVSPEYGVNNVFPIPVNEIEREENYDRNDPFAVRFRWVSLGNRTLENWEVAHFRLLGNDTFLPYGSSVIEAARRVWRQLILIEDAMLVYRIVRAPERRVFYVDVGNLAASEVEMYMEKQKVQLRSSHVMDMPSGHGDLRYNPMCNSLKTLIKLQDGRCISLGDLIKEWDSGKQDQWVYSIDVDGKKIVPGKIVWAGMTRKDAQMVRVHLDDGTYLDTTPDHRFMLRDGSYCEAQNLQSDFSLMPFYFGHSSKLVGDKINGYEKVYDPFLQKYAYTHRLNVIAEQGFQALVGKVVHHHDHNKLNNNPENLVPLTWKEHQTLHGNLIVEYNKSPIGRSNSRNRMKKTWKSGKLNKELYRKLWQDKKVRSARVNALTLNIGDKFVDHCKRVMTKLNKGLSTKESEFRSALNSDQEFILYIHEHNLDFKNGSKSFSRSALQSRLKLAGFAGAFGEFKRWFVITNNDFQKIVSFCQATKNAKRQDVLKQFNLQRRELELLIENANFTYDQFSAQHLSGNLRYKNHKVAKVEWLEQREDTGCVTIEKYHNFAAGGHNQRDLTNPDSFVCLHNSVDEDIWVPVRGETGTKIETLPGGQNTAAVEDVAYIQKKLFAALKVPRAYLGYDDALSSKAGLAQEDIRFSRSISIIQRTLIAELNKIAIIHLYSHGFDGTDLQNFSLRLSNPSTVATQQKLELWRTRFEIAALSPEGMASRDFIRSHIWDLTPTEIEQIDKQRHKEKLVDSAIDAAQAPDEAGGGDLSGGLGGEEFGGGGEEEPPTEEPSEELPPENAAEEHPEDELELLTSSDDASDRTFKGMKLPIKPNQTAQRVISAKQRESNNHQQSKAKKDLEYKLSRRRNSKGASKNFMPDLNKMTSNNSREMSDPFDASTLNSIATDPLGESYGQPPLSRMTLLMLERMASAKNIKRKTLVVESAHQSSEGLDVQDQIDKIGDEVAFNAIDLEVIT